MADDFDNCTECRAVLVPTIVSETSNKKERLSFLRIIDQESYDEIKKDRGTGFEIPIEGVPVKFSGTYNDFSQKRNALFEQHGYNSSVDEAKTFLRTSLQPEAIDAWLECINTRTNRTGIKAKVSRRTPTLIAVTYLWFPPTGSPNSGTVTSSTVVGGKISTDIRTEDGRGALPGEALPRGYVFSNNSQLTVFYDRVAGQDFVLNLNINGLSTPVLWEPGVVEPDIIGQARIDFERVDVADDRGFHDGPAQFRLYAKAEAVTTVNTQSRDIVGVIAENHGGSRLSSIIDGDVTIYPVDKSAFIKILPNDQKIRITCYLCLEVGLRGGPGGSYMTNSPQFTIELNRNGEQWSASPSTTSPLLQGIYAPQGTKFQGVLRYAVKFSKATD